MGYFLLELVIFVNLKGN